MTRRPLVLWHRWFGLIAALWLFLMGATGSVLVFYKEIDRALNPDLFHTVAAQPGSMQPGSVQAMADAAARARPGFHARFIDVPKAPGDTAIVWLGPDAGVDDAGASWQVFVDPATARVLGMRDYNAIDLSRRGLMNFLYTFHYSLHLGETVQWLLGLIALAWLIDHGIALALSFPKAARWRESFRIRRGVAGHKRTFDLHRAIGLWLFPVTAVIAFSGVYFNLDTEFRAVVNAASPLTKRADETAATLPTPLARPRVTFDAAMARAGAAQVDGVAYNAAKGLYWLRLFDPRDIDKYGRRWMFVDATSGRIVSDRHAAQGSAGDVVMAWQFPLHSGKAFGWWGRIAICLAGIATCMFVVTGLMLWARKRRARALHAARPEPATRSLQPAE